MEKMFFFQEKEDLEEFENNLQVSQKQAFVVPLKQKLGSRNISRNQIHPLNQIRSNWSPNLEHSSGESLNNKGDRKIERTKRLCKNCCLFEKNILMIASIIRSLAYLIKLENRSQSWWYDDLNGKVNDFDLGGEKFEIHD